MRRLLRKAAAPWGRRLAVLAYHRISASESDPHGLSVSPARFREQIDWLRSSFPCVPLARIPSPLPKRAFALTFDDGYADALSEAAPLLSERGLPATVFVQTGPLEERRAFWWDELSALFSGPPDGVRTLLLPDGEWSLDGTPEASGRAHRAVHAVLRGLPPARRDAALEALRRQLPPPHAALPMPLSREELLRLAALPGMEIGGHTVSHPVLSVLPEAEQLREIADGRRALERLLERPVTSFAYPFGGPGDIGPTTTACVREAGFRRACTSVPEPVTDASDPFLLPRMTVRNWDLPAFKAALLRFFGS